MRRDDGTASIKEVMLYKFGYRGIANNAKDALNIVPQVLEFNIYESIFSPVIKGELVIADAIGLFTNYPFTGEEIIKVTYEVSDFQRTEYFIIEEVEKIEASDDNRITTFILNIVSMEAWANARRYVQKAYRAPITTAIRQIFTDYIEKDIKTILPGFPIKNFVSRSSSETDKVVIIPNLRPFAAIKFLTNMIVSHDANYNWLFYQNRDGYRIETIQDMILPSKTINARRKAFNNKYRYTSDQIDDSKLYSNEGRLVTNLRFNRRFTGVQKIDLGYFQNKYVEINIPQMGFNIKETKPTDVEHISVHDQNTLKYRTFTPLYGSQRRDEANRVRYFVTTQREENLSFPISEKRERWGKELIENIALSQVDLTITILGNPELKAGELFYLEIPKIHGFNVNEEDDLISGFFLITEKNDTINQTGQYITNLRIQKDSYDTSVDRPSEYSVSPGEDIFM